MRSFNIKSLFLGIGIGMVFTSIISMIFFFAFSTMDLSEEEIKQLARQYGMVEKSEVVQLEEEKLWKNY